MTGIIIYCMGGYVCVYVRCSVLCGTQLPYARHHHQIIPHSHWMLTLFTLFANRCRCGNKNDCASYADSRPAEEATYRMTAFLCVSGLGCCVKWWWIWNFSMACIFHRWSRPRADRAVKYLHSFFVVNLTRLKLIVDVAPIRCDSSITWRKYAIKWVTSLKTPCVCFFFPH